MTTKGYNRSKEKNLTKEIIGSDDEAELDSGEEHKGISTSLLNDPVKIKLGDIFPQLAQLSANGSEIAT